MEDEKEISEIRNVIVNSLITAEGLRGSLVSEISELILQN